MDLSIVEWIIISKHLLCLTRKPICQEANWVEIMFCSVINEIFCEYKKLKSLLASMKPKLNRLSLCNSQENYSGHLGSFRWVSIVYELRLKKDYLWTVSLHLINDEQVFPTLA